LDGDTRCDNGEQATADTRRSGMDGDVLVVEDDPEISELVGAYVELAGYRYRSARDGQEALRQVRESRPAMIVMDVMLPDLDGFEVCRRLKSDDGTSRLPVMILSALDREEHRVRGCQCGAIAYLTKPFDPDQLMGLIRDHVGREAHAR
jgi:DNA-binding response OmpR family regulator